MVMRKKSAKNTDSISELSVWRFLEWGHIGWEMESLFFSSVCDWDRKKIYIYKPWKAIFRTFFLLLCLFCLSDASFFQRACFGFDSGMVYVIVSILYRIKMDGEFQYFESKKRQFILL